MVIPNSKLDKYGLNTWYEERVEAATTEEHHIGENSITVLYETPYEGFTYGCSPKDAVHMLSLLPSDDWSMIELVIFRQPKRKQIQQNPVWGRMMYYATIGKRQGAAIYLEAQEIGSCLRWSRKLSLEDQLELGRLIKDGHEVDENRREYMLTLSQESIRNTLLYRTFLHEIGHWVQYEKETLDYNTALSENSFEACDLYFAHPPVERESFAHRYAEQVGERLRREGLIPFTLG